MSDGRRGWSDGTQPAGAGCPHSRGCLQYSSISSFTAKTVTCLGTACAGPLRTSLPPPCWARLQVNSNKHVVGSVFLDCSTCMGVRPYIWVHMGGTVYRLQNETQRLGACESKLLMGCIWRQDGKAIPHQPPCLDTQFHSADLFKCKQLV